MDVIVQFPASAPQARAPVAGGSLSVPVDGVRAVAATLGVGVGVSGLDHGFFEALQGNVATPGLFVQAIGSAQRMWAYGTEDAFTLVPNFLVSGLLSMLLGLLVIAWSVGFVHRPYGARVLLVLGLCMVAVGGGVAAFAFLLFAWWAATRIGRPIQLARRLPPRVALPLSRGWRAILGIGVVLFAFALEVAIAGRVPGISNPDQIELVCWTALVAMFVAMVLALLGTSAAEVHGQSGSRLTRARPGYSDGR